MPVLTPGLVHTPVTPFSHDGGIALEVYGKLLDFHVANGAQSLALPMHIGESVSLTDGERRALLEFAIARLGDRIPVLAHVSESGSAIAAELARHAEKAGAAAVIATTPYYWTPPATMLIEHFVAIGAATGFRSSSITPPRRCRGRGSRQIYAASSSPSFRISPGWSISAWTGSS